MNIQLFKRAVLVVASLLLVAGFLFTKIDNTKAITIDDWGRQSIINMFRVKYPTATLKQSALPVDILVQKTGHGIPEAPVKYGIPEPWGPIVYPEPRYRIPEPWMPFVTPEPRLGIPENPWAPIVAPVIPEDDVAFTVIAKGQMAYGSDKQDEYTIVDAKTWGEKWDQINSYNLGTIIPLPTVNFDEEMLIAVFQGPKNTGGYSIAIKKVIETGLNIEVSVVITEPGRGCITTQALTSPYIIVKIRKTDKQVIFKNNENIVECSGPDFHICPL